MAKVINLNKELSINFTLVEFIRNRWFSKQDNQTADELYLNDRTIRHNLKVLATQLQILRDYLNCPVRISIALRPVPYELSKGRSGNSRHTLGLAADIYADDYTPQEVYNAIEELIAKGIMLDGGLGLYASMGFVHYDFTMNSERRWRKAA